MGRKRKTAMTCLLNTKHPKRAVGDLIFRSGFRDVQKAANKPSDFLAQSTGRTNRNQSEIERSKNQVTHRTRPQAPWFKKAPVVDLRIGKVS